LRIKF
jgi:hypothetical protein